MNKSELGKEVEKAVLSLTIWPHRSCSKRNFQFAIFLIALGLMFPSFLLYNLKLDLTILTFSLITIILLFISCEKTFKDAQLMHRSEPKGDIKYGQ